MAGGAVSWESKKQGCVSQSSPEATCMDLSSAAKQAIWLSKIFAVSESESGRRPVLIFVDTQGAIKMSKNDSSSTRTKHIDIQYHFVRDSLAKKLFSIDFCPTQEMAADLLKSRLLASFSKSSHLFSNLSLSKVHRGMWQRGSVEIFGYVKISMKYWPTEADTALIVFSALKLVDNNSIVIS